MLPKIEIHNSLTRRKETLQPIEPGRLRVYVCGVTVYDFCHIGHARCYIVFDMIVRYLRARGYAVEYVRNITDIDDKIIRRAAENSESIDSLTSRFINEMYADFDALGIVRPDVEPRATEHMAGIIDMIAVLIERGMAYRADNGDVYYSVAKFPTYGRLSGKRIEDLRAGERVDVSEAKHDPLDFVLWKSAKPGEPSWDSPWGKGRPGWHIECSAMSKACLGEHFDIHGGGKDLIFPHHENEVAQSCGASGGEFVNLWIHNGFVNINEEKMSKSLDNFFTIREVRKHFHPEVIRYFLLSSHYRSPLNYSDDNLEKARINLERMYLALRGEVSDSGRNDYADRFHAVMQDDFNTPQAMAVLFEIVTAINTASESDKPALRANLKSLAAHLGLLQQDAETYLRGDSADVVRIEQLIAERNQARKDRNFARADAIRDELLAEGILLEDGAEGTTWRRQ